METHKLEIQRQETLIQETEFETVAVLDISKIKQVLCGEDLDEAGYLMQVFCCLVNLEICILASFSLEFSFLLFSGVCSINVKCG